MNNTKRVPSGEKNLKTEKADSRSPPITPGTNGSSSSMTSTVIPNPEFLIPCNRSGHIGTCGKETVCQGLPPHKNENPFYCFCPYIAAYMTERNTCDKIRGKHGNGQISLKLESGTKDWANSTTTTDASKRVHTNNPIIDKKNSTFNNTSTNYTITSAAPEYVIKAPNSPDFTSPVSIISMAVGLLLVVMALFLWWKCCKCGLYGVKKNKSDKNKVSITPLEKTVIKDQRYTSNPQYSPHAGVAPMDLSIGSVPLLNKNSITDLQKIGEGFFGEVYRGQLHSIDNEEEHIETVAVKRLKQTANKAALDDFLREVEIISSFQHPNILTLVGVCPQENSSPPWMVFEYMSFGDLADVLRNSNPEFCDDDQDVLTLSAEALLSISSQIAAGMEYLASQRFVHRDLACRNCLVGSAMTVKISDFGMSRDVYTCDYYRVGGNRMLPIRWMSPEGLSFGKFTLESDVWSYGVVLWEIYSYGKQPYYGYTNEQAMKLIIDRVRLEIPENCPNEIADIMRSCWQINPKDRIQFLDICNHLSALKEHIDELSAPPLPRPPPMPVTINYPMPFDNDDDDDEFDDILDDDNYLRPISARSSMFLQASNSNLKRTDSSSNPYMETIP